MAGTDGADLLSELSGLSRESILKRWEKAKANKRRLDACARHRFFSRSPSEGSPFGKSFVCLNCGGAMNFLSIGEYIEGYQAAGGNPNDIWPGWE